MYLIEILMVLAKFGPDSGMLITCMRDAKRMLNSHSFHSYK